MAVSNLSSGQQLAQEQLYDIASAKNGTVTLVKSEQPYSEGCCLLLHLSIETKGYKYKDGGFKFRQRERFQVEVPFRFPIQLPIIKFRHCRFSGYPHVQWGNQLCLYLAPDVEWVAKDGMFGFFDRLDKWLCDAACNQLDPTDAPLHPPIGYLGSNTKFVVEIDTPFNDESPLWIGAAKLRKRNEDCYGITDWIKTPQTCPEDKRFAAVILLGQAMPPTEYPNYIRTLILALEERGVPFNLLFSLLKDIALWQKEGEPLYFVLGTPMRRRGTNEALRPHLTVCEIAPEHVKALQTIASKDSEEASEAESMLILEWETVTKTQWCRVFDNRPEVTVRRDTDTNASWFFGRSIALLGCGAIGSHIGEYLARAEASKLLLIDRSDVNPGILVRQQFRHCQIGFAKQESLAAQLRAVNPKIEIDHKSADLTAGWPKALKPDMFHLIIDATASRRVASALQLDLQHLGQIPPLLRCAISDDASLGIASLRMPASKSGPAELMRQIKMVAFDRPELSDFADLFWPREQLKANFQPEPGCSEPTFVGSASDIAFFASSFFSFASRMLNSGDGFATKAFFARKASDKNPMSSLEVTLAEQEFYTEVSHDYRVCLSPRVRKGIEAEINSNARNGSDKNETGGLLLGEIDDSLRSITIDVASGPPPDSKKSPELFLCGVNGTKELCDYHSERSGGSTRFIGVWHTHPVSMPDPSSVDMSAMRQILCCQKKTPRHVVMLIIGHAATKPDWRFHLFLRKDFQRCKERGALDD